MTACSFSTVAPNAPVHISGRVLDPLGHPMPGVRVLLFREADIGQAPFGSILAVGTLGAICYVPDPPAVCDRARTSTTDAAGMYSFTVTGADTQGSLGLEDTLDVVVGAVAGSTTVRFAAKRTWVRVPDARIVLPVFRAFQPLAGPAPIEVRFQPIPPVSGSSPTYGVRFFDHGTLIWNQQFLGRVGAVDPRVLEDFPSTMSSEVGAHLAGGQGTGDVRVSYLSSPVPIRSTAGPPPSRGKPCAAVTGTRPSAIRPTSPCTLTDGVVTESKRLSAGVGVVTGAVIDLGAVRPVKLVVARGFAGQVVLELSADGVHYGTAVTALAVGEPIALSPRNPERARFVRLRSPSGLDESLSNQLAVW